MALVLILVILVIWIGVIGSLYTSIIPFVYSLGNATSYTIAYYGAQMSVERWLLALKYHDAWFEGRSGFGSWNASDDKHYNDLGRLTSDATANTYWSITSRVASIPGSWNGNIESLLAAPDSKNYNSLTYNEWLELPLYLDTTSDPQYYYTSGAALEVLNGWSSYTLQGRFRLPPKVKDTLGNLWLDEVSDIDDDQIYDDVIATRWYKWYDILLAEPFSISPTIKQDFAAHMPLYEYDNAIRESTINAWDIGDNIDTNDPTAQGFNITKGSSSITGHNVLPLWGTWETIAFNNMLQDSSILSALTFSISNRMQNSDGNYYPFLEWQLRACDTASSICWVTMPDRFYSLEGVGTIWDYTVRMKIKKPVRKTTNWSSFTIIF
jgi:hypothetical protein